MSEPTPTPWHVTLTPAGKEVEWVLWGPRDDNGISQFVGLTKAAFATRAERAKANAEFIVRACNAHEALVEACEDDHQRLYAADLCSCDDTPGEVCHMAQAIAKAREVTP